MATYPNAVVSLPATNPTDNMKTTNPTHSARHTADSAEIVAIETELGTNPKGAAASVKARLDTLDTTVASKVPQTTTVNGHALSGNVSVTASDVGLGSVENAAASGLYVPLTRTVNSKALSGDISLDKTDIGLSNVANTAQVTSVGATAPISSSGGTTPTISTSMATNKLIGRGTAGTGVMEEITLGTNLSLSGTTLNATSSTAATETSFTDASLSAGVLTITHNKGLAAGYTAIVTIVNNSGAVVIPDQINTFATNSFKVDLTSYGTLSGTWYCTYITK